ncbi:hypothetical protein ASPVEDRAFT_25298 [Aspergillus versicolor CBS 583.65]|uniref:Uncharacterized protein n=1 Tax=Aspergillus versicolor CBS 583.65 TaxID=1036611 RepID=A0A1L9PA96_ASPVE|nr:uncharacterized protein ASPVEDRAFT_25298 [Aspergillus versicolor CBS 583.65]OJI98418.1 hypothetical protein ASPVEDRAFT_25298 [Aspergillus versicolor CBS 583.65]
MGCLAQSDQIAGNWNWNWKVQIEYSTAQKEEMPQPMITMPAVTKNLAITGLLFENPDSRPFLNLPTSKSGPHAPGYSIRQPVTPNRETCLAQTACAGCRAPTLPGRKRFGAADLSCGW